MLLSPLPLPESIAKPDRVAVVPIVRCAAPIRGRARSQSAGTIPVVLGVWIVLGAVLLVLAPLSGTDRSLGATLPFWLVGAPAIDLLWWKRRTIAAALRDVWRARRHRRRGAVSRRRGARRYA